MIKDLKQDIFITGIDTDIGKTIASAIFTEALNYDYWKPVQTGGGDTSDTKTVQELVSNNISKFHKESFLLKEPVSPHAAAKLENIQIDINQIKRPQTKNNLIIEGAGGVFVPFNENDCMIDLIKKLSCCAVVVSKNYLGSINHTILTIEALKNKNIPIMGIIFNGDENHESESFILNYTKLKMILRINNEKEIKSDIILSYAEKLKKNIL